MGQRPECELWSEGWAWGWWTCCRGALRSGLVAEEGRAWSCCWATSTRRIGYPEDGGRAGALGQEVGWEDTRTCACPAFKVLKEKTAELGTVGQWLSLFHKVSWMLLLTNVHSIPTETMLPAVISFVLVRTQWNRWCSSFLVLSSVPLDDDLSLCNITCVHYS